MKKKKSFNIGEAGRSVFRRIGLLIRNFAIIFLVFTVLWVLLLREVPVYITPLMLIRNVEQIVDDKPLSLKKKWVDISEISPKMVSAVVASEDANFIEHWGFDFDAIGKAVKHNASGKSIVGASTISQQTAKNVFLWPSRSYFRKGLEAYFTVLIELFWSKERIMEVYLNVIETGDGIYGVERAANLYYDVSANQLTTSQAAMIAASLPNPIRYNAGTPTSYLRKRQKKIMASMRVVGEVRFKE